jgi:hypothetical protein
MSLSEKALQLTRRWMSLLAGIWYLGGWRAELKQEKLVLV